MSNQQSIDQIKKIFSDPSELRNAIDLRALLPLSLTKAQNNPQLSHFFRLDEDGPFSEIIKKGFLSLRKGLYKIISQPHYRTDIFPGTFAAEVYYYNIGDDNLIKYHANVGPLTNTAMSYRSLNRNYNGLESIPIVQDFFRDRKTCNPNQDFKEAKERFFNTVFNQERIIYVREAVWDPAYPTINKIKKTTWCFIDF